MRKLLNKIKLTFKVNFIVLAILISLSTISGIGTISELNKSMQEEVLASQEKNLKTAAAIFERDLDLFSIENKGSVKQKITLSAMPEFSDHQIIDEIGFTIDATATIFLWDSNEQDFYRKTTNIIKDDGKRAVGTPLGKTSAAYPVVTKGERFLGKANILGKDYFTLYEPIFKKGSNDVVGILYVGMPEAKFIEQEKKIIDSNIKIATIVTIAAIAALMLLLKHILTKPLDSIVAQTKRLAEGEKNFEIEGADRGDEIGNICKALEIFRHNLLEVDKLNEAQKQAEIRQVEERKKALVNIANSFEERVGVVVKSVEQAASDMQAMSVKIAAVVQETSHQSASAASAAQEASSNVETVAAAAEELSSSIKEISRNVTDTKNSTKICTNTAKSTKEILEELHKAVQDIDTIIQSITEVAEQTNLLALNATIEAARAGEAGRGFAVVANEVKALANETHKMTEEISNNVQKIKSSSDNTISSVNKIIEQIEEVDGKTTNVAAAIEEQNSSTNEISRNIQEASKGTNEVSSNIGDIQEATNENAAAIEELSAGAKSLAEQSATLKSAMDEFLKEIRES